VENTETDKARILIIEDDRDIREMMRFDLSDAGYRIETAANGIKGLEKFGSGEDWDVVLLDQRMPRMEGMEVLRHMRERDPMVRVIVITAHASVEFAAEAMKNGAIDFLRKPFSFDVLRGAVKVTLTQPRQAIGEESRPLQLFNGFQFRPMPLPPREEETTGLRVRRAFEVEAPSGEKRYCAVDISLYVRQLVELITGHNYEPSDSLWDAICERVLSDYLWQNAEIAPELLPVHDLTEEQLQVVRKFAG
jgi:FixJ family two-component response regulator